MTEDKENEEACRDSPHHGDAEDVQVTKPASLEEKLEKEIVAEDNGKKEEEKGKETEKNVEVEERSGGDLEIIEDKIEEKKDNEGATEDDREKNLEEEVDGKTLVFLPKQKMIIADVNKEGQKDAPLKDHSNGNVSGKEVRKDDDMDLHEEAPIDEHNKSEKGTTQEEACTVKSFNENDVDSQVNAPMPDPSLDANMEVDEKIPVKSEEGPVEEVSIGPCTVSLDGQKNVDNGSVSERHGRDEAPHAGPSALNPQNVKLEPEENVKEMPMTTNTEPTHTYLFDGETSEGGESGTEEEQSAFMNKLESFFKEKNLEFKPPKFYGEPLNLLKLWRAVIKLGGYDKVTACKLWRQVGESFRPPKTCTTVSWTFRIFYEKALLDYEKHKIHGGELNIPISQSEPICMESSAGNGQALGSGRARRDAAARAMQGWHSQRLLGNGEVSDPIIKDKGSVPLKNKEKHLKNIGVQKRKRPSAMETPLKAMRPKVIKTQSDSTTIIDIGPPADWVKINVKTTKDCYEVYALVPGLLREEVRVQTDPAGRLVITGEPEHADNPWGVTPFKKIVSLPSRIDPHQTSAVVTLHGQLFVRVPFEHSG